MNSRELVSEAIAHREPSRIPFTLYLAEPLHKKLEEIWGQREDWPCPCDDLIRILLEVEVADVSSVGFRDSFGCEWKREHGGYVFVNPPLDVPDAGRIPQIDLVPESDIERIIQAREQKPGSFIFYQFTFTFGERLWSLRGMEQALMDYMLEPKFVHEALDILVEMHIKALDKILSLPIDAVSFGDDFGGQDGLIFGRDVFRKFFKPRYATMYEKVMAAGKIVGHHSCGDNTELMGDLIDIGLQVFHPLQPESMDISAIKREYGRDLTFRGGIGTQGGIVSGTCQQARSEVRQAVKILSAGGGYLMETAKPLPEETPVENAIAVIEEMTRAMNYQFGDEH